MAIALAMFLTWGLAAEAQTAGRIVEAARVFERLQDFYQLPASERTLFRPSYAISLDGVSANGVFSLNVGGVSRPIHIDSRGVVLNPPTPVELQNGAKSVVATQRPARMNMSLEPVLPLGPSLASADVIGAVEQVNRAIDRFAGLASVFAPKMTGIAFTAPATAAGVLVMPDGKRVALKYRDGAFEILASDARRSTRLEFRSAPTGLRFLQ